MTAAEVEAEEAKHQAYLDVIANQAPLSESASVPQQAVQSAVGADSSPSAVERVEEMLTVEWAKLSEELPMAKQVEATARSRRQFVEHEMDRVRRLLAAHKRLREPIHRKRT
jgi:hypothetical protein